MSVSVPIKPKDKFGFPISQPETILQTQPVTDLAFLKKLGDEGKLITRSGTRTSDGNIVSIVPNTGETFYYLFGSWSIITGTDCTITLENDGNVIESVVVIASQSPQNGLFVSKFNSMIGDRIRAFTATADVTGATTAF